MKAFNKFRSPPKANLFTPQNDFAHGKFYAVNVPEMAQYTGSQPLLIEQTFGILPSQVTYLPSPSTSISIQLYVSANC
jgi:hypothetical protein